MARPVSYNVNIERKPLENDISMAAMPDGYQGEGFFASKLSDVVGLARKTQSFRTKPGKVIMRCHGGHEFNTTAGSSKR